MHYQDVVEFTNAFEVETYKGNECDLFDKSVLMQFRISLISEEINELNDAMRINNENEILDAFIDILYVTYGAIVVFRYNNFTQEDQLKYNLIQKNNGAKYSLTFISNKMIYEEINSIFEHLLISIKNKDYPKMIIYLDSLLLIVYRCIDMIHIDCIAAFKIVHESNMSKLCCSENEAIETVASYNNDPRYDTPVYRESRTKNKWIVYNKSTSKILKSVNYKVVDFSIMNF